LLRGGRPKRQSLKVTGSACPTRGCSGRRCRAAAERLIVRRQGGIVTVKRMDNVGIVVEDIDAALSSSTELGLELEGRAPIEGDWADASLDYATCA